MDLKVHLFGSNGKITGIVDAPKIKKRACRTHFGLLALLNHPKLSKDWFSHCKNRVTVHQATIEDRAGDTLANRDELNVNPRDIIWAFEEDPKERRRLKREQAKAPVEPCEPSGDRLRFSSECGMIFEGDYNAEVNELGVMRGQGFITLANATVISTADPASFRKLPFVAVNSHAVTNITAAKTVAVEEKAAVSAA
jgi:hypothetical protein